jgi:hypothetical protein
VSGRLVSSLPKLRLRFSESIYVEVPMRNKLLICGIFVTFLCMGRFSESNSSKKSDQKGSSEASGNFEHGAKEIGKGSSQGGKEMAKGSAEFGKNLSKGELGGAGKSMGKGAGELGKGVGKGTAVGFKNFGKGIGGLGKKVEGGAKNNQKKTKPKTGKEK